MNNIAQYYAVLGVDFAASPEIVKQAYRNLAKIWHPDRSVHDPRLKAQAEIEIKKINQAYEAIKSYWELKHKTSEEIDSYSQSQVSTKKNTPDFYYCQGVNYAKQQNYDDALISFAQAIKLDADHIEAYQYRGFILSKLGYEYRAASEFNRANQIKTKHKPSSSPSPANTSKPQTNAFCQKSVRTQVIKSCQSILAANQAITSVVISSDNQMFASINNDREIKLWEINTRQRIGTLRGHTDIVKCLLIDSRGKTLISGSKDKTIRFWDLKTKKIIKTFGGYFNGHSGAIFALALSPDNKALLSYGTDNTIKTWDINRGEINQSIDISADLTCLNISPNCRLFCSSSLDPQLRIRQIENGQVIRSINNGSGVFCLTFSPDSNMLATGGFDRVIRIWDINTGKILHTLVGHSDRLSSLVFSLDGKTLFSSSWDQTIKAWQLKTGEEISSIKSHSSKIQTMAFASNNQTLISGDDGGKINIWRCFF
jgi:WD40 repeat protein